MGGGVSIKTIILRKMIIISGGPYFFKQFLNFLFLIFRAFLSPFQNEEEIKEKKKVSTEVVCVLLCIPPFELTFAERAERHCVSSRRSD